MFHDNTHRMHPASTNRKLLLFGVNGLLTGQCYNGQYELTRERY